MATNDLMPRTVAADVAPSLLVSDATADDSDKTFTVPAGKEWEIFFVTARLVSTATVGNRQMRLEIGDGTNLFWFKNWGAVQAASLTRDYFAGPSLPEDSAFDAGGRLRMLFEPRLIILPAGWTVRLFDSAAIAAAADDMTVRILGRER
jgi:hypothetical protein